MVAGWWVSDSANSLISLRKLLIFCRFLSIQHRKVIKIMIDLTSVDNFLLWCMWQSAMNSKRISVVGGCHRSILSNRLSFSCINFWMICHYGRSIGANGRTDESEKYINEVKTGRKSVLFINLWTNEQAFVKNDKTLCETSINYLMLFTVYSAWHC